MDSLVNTIANPSFITLLFYIAIFLFIVGLIFYFSIFRIGKLSKSSNRFSCVRFNNSEINSFFDSDLIYIQILLPKYLEVTNFQVQQKLFKTIHSTYKEVINKEKEFSKHQIINFIQKYISIKKLERSNKEFFVFQVWGEYPFVSFRILIKKNYYERIEQAISDVYPNSEIEILDINEIVSKIESFRESQISIGEGVVEGKLSWRFKTFKDVSSDPIESIISKMANIKKGQFMCFSIFVSPVSHFFNQLINEIINDNKTIEKTQVNPNVPIENIEESIMSAMVEKSRFSLFQTIINFWVISESKEVSESKLDNLQSQLHTLEQKNMNSFRLNNLINDKIGNLKQYYSIKDIILSNPHFSIKKGNYGQIIGESELFTLWHLPNTNQDSSNQYLQMIRYKKLPASQTLRNYNEKFLVNLGYSNYRNDIDVDIGVASWEDMKRHMYILGGTGSGKSETLKTIIKNLLSSDTKRSILVIDPKNDFATDILSFLPENRKQDVIYFNPPRQTEKPICIPFFNNDPISSIDEKMEFIISLMKRFVQIDGATSWGPELENILRNLFRTSYILPKQSLSGLNLLLNDDNQINTILPYLNSKLQKFWVMSILKKTDSKLSEYLSTTNNKIGKFIDYQEFTNIVDSTESKFNFTDVIQQGKIFIANLGYVSDLMKSYYSVYLSNKIAEAIFKQVKIDQNLRKPAVFIVDEFQRVSSDIFLNLFSEVRAFNTSLVISNQFMGQLSPDIKKSIEANIATKLFMRTQSTEDAEIAEKIVGSGITFNDFMNLPIGNAYLKTIINGVPQDSMSIKITKTDYSKDVIDDVENFYINNTMEKYGIPKDDIIKSREFYNSAIYTSNNKDKFSDLMKNIKKYEVINFSDFQVKPETVTAETEVPIPSSNEIKIPSNVKSIYDFKNIK